MKGLTARQIAKLQRIVTRAARDQFTAQASHETLLADAWRLYETSRRWPTKRYRVEGSRAGNSACLPLKVAIQLAIRCGGKAVEVIPSRKEALAKQRAVVMP